MSIVYRSLSVEKVTVSCSLDFNGIIGPSRFEDADRRTVTASTEL